jgi:hypothetical protein
MRPSPCNTFGVRKNLKELNDCQGNCSQIAVTLIEKLAGLRAAAPFPANFLYLISSLLNGPWRKIVAVVPFPQC